MLAHVTVTCLLTASHQISGSGANITAQAEIVKHTVAAQFVSGSVVCYICREKKRGKKKKRGTGKKRKYVEEPVREEERDL